MLHIDGSDFAKKGTNSVGVALTYYGISGNTKKCQAGCYLANLATNESGHMLSGMIFFKKVNLLWVWSATKFVGISVVLAYVI